MMKAAKLFLALAIGGCVIPVRDDGRAGRGTEGRAAFALSLPLILPPLVVIHPGISVFADQDQEVFYSDGYYWARQDSEWYHARDPHGSWSRVERGRVSPTLDRLPPGRYRRWRGDDREKNAREYGRHVGRGGDRD
jgi:hypothetical protein